MATNRLKSLRLQQQNGNYSSEIVISPDAKNVYLENNQDLQKAVGNYNPQSDGGTIKANLDQIKQDIQNLNANKAGKNEVGKPPKIAKTAGEMSDTNSVYVYTGETTSTLTKGNWYSYSNGEWVSGGSYIGNPVTVDSTLLESGSAADAKVTGDSLKNLQQLINTKDFDLSNILIRQQDDGYSFYLVDRNDPNKKTENSLGLKLPIDKTLKIEDYVADAKATGDAIADLDNYTKQQVRLLNELYDALQIATIGDGVTSLKSLITDLNSKTLGANYDPDNGDLQTQIADLITLTISTNTPGNLQAQINDINSNSFGTEEGGNSLQQQIDSLHNEVFGEEGQSSGTSLKDELAQLQRQTLGTAAADNSLKQQIDALNTATLGEKEGDNSLKQQLEQVQADLEESIENAIKVDDLGLYQDPTDKKVYPTFRRPGNASASDPTGISKNGIQISSTTDSSLTIFGQAADAGAVRNELNEIQENLNELNMIDADSFALEQNPDSKEVYIVYKNQRSANGVVIAGGGGGGGIDENDAIFTATKITTWASKTLTTEATDKEYTVEFNWSSLENNEPTGPGGITITVGNSIKGSLEIQQGDIQLNLKPYLSVGNNTVKIRISDSYGNGKTYNFTITLTELYITSNYSFDAPLTKSFSFTFKPFGVGTKTVHFEIDDIEIGTMETAAAGDNTISYPIPAQSHGKHSLRCYFSTIINGQEKFSNELYYEFIFLADESISKPIIISSFDPKKNTFNQYSNIVIPYKVYNPNSEITQVFIYTGDQKKGPFQVGSGWNDFIYQANTAGDITISIEAGEAEMKLIHLNILPVNINLSPVDPTQNRLSLYLSSIDRSNNDKTDIRSSWIYEGNQNDPSKYISATLTDFNWKLDGWQTDENNFSVLRVMGKDSVNIPYQIFNDENDFSDSGLTIELEFSVKQVADYNFPVLKCIDKALNSSIGFYLTPQKFSFSGPNTKDVEVLYKDNEHIRLSLVIDRQQRLIFIYINGILSKAIQYANGEIFRQLNPSNIIIGLSEEEKAQGLESGSIIDIYNIRIYHSSLTSRQIVQNWIADTRDGNLKIKRYTRNNIYSNNKVTIESLNTQTDLHLPYMVLKGDLPTTKLDSDKPGYIPMTVAGYFRDPLNPSKNFDFDNGCEINVQGTSSSVYFRKNYDLKFKKCKFKMLQSDGSYTIADTYSLRDGSIPFNRFVLKADVASSESTNNTGLVMFYNDTCPYKTNEMLQNSKVRWGIEGIPIVLFHESNSGDIEFLGKYNFNLPKRAAQPYGYSGNDESWEVEWNNTANVKFQDNNFADRPGEQNYNWKLDFQARFPDSDWYNIDQLKEFVSWVKSTWREDPSMKQNGEYKTFNSPYPQFFVSNRDTVDLYPDDNSYTVTTATDENGISIGYNITFSKDTPAYRLTKFRAEFDQYAEIESAAFYYLFTETFLLIDSWAKNMFLGFHGSNLIKDENNPNGIFNTEEEYLASGRKMKRKVVFEPYDMDTAIGIDNTGALKYGYSLESIDHVAENAGGALKSVFEAQDSVLWSNFRDAFQYYIATMYASLRQGNKIWSYKIVEDYFEKHQAKWSEAIFNEDSYIKYLYPVYNGYTDENEEDSEQGVSSTEYLSKLLGSKEQQRKWWLQNRFYYMDSKYNAGDARNISLDFRASNRGYVDLKYAIDLYPAISFGLSGKLDIQRASANTPVHFLYDENALVQNLESSIWSGNLVTDVGDLYNLYPGAVKFAKGTRLRTLKVGSDKITLQDGRTIDYQNSNLTELEIKSALLEYIDCRNCNSLSILVDLEVSSRLKTALFEGTKITGVLLPEGCLIQTLHLPATVTSLYLIDCVNLIDFQIPTYSNISTLYLSNINPQVIDFIEVLKQMQEGSFINIKGFNITFEDDSNNTAIEKVTELFNLLEKFSGVTREKSGNNWVQRIIPKNNPNTAISGIINIDEISGDLKKIFNDKYPYIEIKAQTIKSTVYYYDWEGNLITTKQIIANKNNPNPNAPDIQHPVRPNTAQYTYTWAGWALELGGRYTNRALQDIQSDRNVYAAYNFEGKTYTVRFLNRTNSSGSYTILQTKTEVMYGANVSYTGATPVSYQGPADEYEWGTRGVDPNDPEGNGVYPWSPMPTNIQGNLDCYAQFKDIRSIVSQYFAGTLTNIKLNNLNSVGNYAFFHYPNFTLNTGEIIVQNNVGYAAFQGADYIYGQNNKPILIKANVIGGYGFADKRFSSNTRTLKIQAQILDTGSFQNALESSLSSNRITTVELIQPEDSTTPIQIRDAAFRQEDLQPFTKLIINSPYKARLANQTSLPGVFKYCLGGIYVPSDLLDEYKSDSNWGRYKYHIFPMENKDIPIENIDFSTISKTWAEIVTDCNSDQPLDTSIYHTGDIKKFTVNGVSHYAILIGINKDKLASDNTKTAKTTWISWSPIGSRRIHNNSNTTINWEDCQLRTYLKNTIKPQLEEDIRNNLKTVTKTFYDATQALTLVTQDDITIPSYYEIMGSNFESSSSLSVNYGNLSNQSILKGDNYKQMFLKNLSTESSSSGDNYYKRQWTRTSSSLGYFYLVGSGGYYFYPYYRFPGMDTRDTTTFNYDTRLNTSSCYYRIMFCL